MEVPEALNFHYNSTMPILIESSNEPKVGSFQSDRTSKVVAAATVLQRHIRSSLRYDLHVRIFEKPPQWFSPTARMLAECPHVLSIINRLALEGAIIPMEMLHISTWKNLASICQHGALFGAESLKKLGIIYESNTLGEDDIKYFADGDTFCLAPNLIDFRASSTKSIKMIETKYGKSQIPDMKTKEGAIQIKFDVTKIETAAPYFRFFKLKDFLANDFFYQLDIFYNMTILFESTKRSPGNYRITIQCKEYNSVSVNKHENIIYGDHYQMNWGCMLSLFHVVDKLPQKGIDDFYNTIKNYDELMFVKTLKLYGQHLIAHSEYNFHGQLNCPDNFISEIVDINTGDCYSLKKLDPTEYRQNIQTIAESRFTDLPLSKDKIMPYQFDKDGSLKSVWGRSINMYGFVDLADVKFVNEKPEKFMNSKYFNYFESAQKSSSK